MIRADMAVLLAKVQLGDNRHVDGLVVDYWMDTIGDLDFETAVMALRRFRRERPGVYLEPGHLLELAGVPQESEWVDRTDEALEAVMRRDLSELGFTPEQYRSDPAVRARVDVALDARQIEGGDV